jgi:hypothetical protein
MLPIGLYILDQQIISVNNFNIKFFDLNSMVLQQQIEVSENDDFIFKHINV